MRGLSRGALLALAGAAGCVPYSVGSTAQPVPVGDWVPANSLYFIPAGIEASKNTADTTRSVSLVGNDVEVRYGLDDVSDIGLRIPGFIGIVVDYKRRLTGATSDDPALAMMIGGGIVNAGQHGIAQFTMVYSARQRINLTPYGGIRLMQTFPLTQDARQDRITAGGFFGVRIGRMDEGFSPEIGVFYDHSTLGWRKRDVIVVPSVTIHGADLLKLLSRR